MRPTTPTSVLHRAAGAYSPMRGCSNSYVPHTHTHTTLTNGHAQHITECHDPLATLRRERGDKIVRIFSFSHIAVPYLTH